MQFLDAIGLASFWKKIKNWVNINYLSLTGGTIRGSVSFLNEADGGKSIRIDPSNITNSKYGVNYLFASGKMIPIGEANGVAGLDTNGNVPLANLGNLDTTVAEVVTALPTSNIKRHIYLVKDSDTANNKYAEYVYTGDISAAYDSTKWEKLGDFRATVDLADYAKKKEAMHSMDVYHTATDIQISLKGVNDFPLGFIAINAVTSQSAGVMIPSDKTKLDGIANNANNYSLPLAANGTRGGIQVGYAANGRNYPVQLSGEKAYVNVPWTDTRYDLTIYAKKNETIHELILDSTSGDTITFNINYANGDQREIILSAASQEYCGLMSNVDKTKLDGIANNANNYSLPTASSTTKGGITLGYSQSGKNYPVALDSNGKAYVNVPWTDTNTTYDLSPYAKTADVNAALAKKVDVVSGKGLSTEDFTAALKTKLNGIATGATADSATPISVIDALN